MYEGLKTLFSNPDTMSDIIVQASTDTFKKTFTSELTISFTLIITSDGS